MVREPTVPDSKVDAVVCVFNDAVVYESPVVCEPSVAADAAVT